LLVLCQDLQSEKDGVVRPAPGVVDRSKTLDPFARDIAESVMYVFNMKRLMPMSEALAVAGRLLHEQGKIKVDAGDDYARAALDHLLASYGLPKAGT
jgi:hypothetical protein